ncbi:unnamed protein product, partial [Mesorhabditis spiculigera]
MFSCFPCCGLPRKKMGIGSSAPIISDKTVETTSGRVRGRRYTNVDGRLVDGFLGIPYAEPPVGELRFQKPVPVKKWADTLDCFHFGPRCPQTDEYFTGFLNIVGKDEAKCLTLNIFAPQWTSEEFPQGHPVMVWIHGGGYTMHSSSNYGDRTLARNLCAKDLIVVSINYRLGIFGFFTTGDEHCLGNNGLWDQTLALQWIRDNIAKFGGDPNNVTVFGQSAGGASSDLLSLSPHSRDLFHKVIPMAGNGECDFAVRTAVDQAKLSRDFAKFIGYKPAEEDTSEDVLAWLRGQYAELLELGMSGKKGFGRPGQLLFVPNLDGDFFPKSLAELRKEAPRKPRMLGVTQHEGLFFVGFSGLAKSYESVERFIDRCLPDEKYENAERLRAEVKELYLKGVDPKDRKEVVFRMAKVLGDWAINAGTWELARIEAELGSPVYLYQFNYFNPDGATHCTELRYILGKGIISKFRPNDDDLKMVDLMTDFFANFAKYGNPNGKTDAEGVWKKHDPQNLSRHLAIELPPKMEDQFIEGRPEFWHKIYLARKDRAHL